MATQTAMQYSGMGGLIAVTVQYDDVLNVVTNVIQKNLSSRAIAYTLKQGNKSFGNTVAANAAQTTVAATKNVFTLALDTLGFTQYNFTFAVVGA